MVALIADSESRTIFHVMPCYVGYRNSGKMLYDVAVMECSGIAICWNALLCRDLCDPFSVDISQTDIKQYGTKACEDKKV